MVEDVLYYIEEAKVVAINLKTGERTEYDFLEAFKEVNTEENLKSYQKSIDSFLMTEDALWVIVSGGISLYRMDLQSGEVTFGHVMYSKGGQGSIITLYTDGTELYGLIESIDSSLKENVVRLETGGMKKVGKFIGTVIAESLTK